MRKYALSLFVSCVFGMSAHAQSTITLDEMQLDRIEPIEEHSSEMGDCLLDQSACESREFKSSATFSIDDVVNLGIIDREAVDAEPASTTARSDSKEYALPSIDLEILFDYDSETLRPDQLRRLNELSGLLEDKRFSQFQLAFIGHTDAKGSASYNQQLSYRRATAVSSYIAARTGVDQSRFSQLGMGSSKLKTPDSPFGASNRRVQLILIPLK